MKTLSVLLASISLTSCMHPGMMGTADDHHSSDAQERIMEPTLEKEVTVGDLRATALFPALKIGEDAILTLRLADAGTGAPISGAQVYLHAQYAHRVTPRDEDAESSSRKKEREHDIDIGEEVAESGTPGVYEISYVSLQAGEHTLMFHVTAIRDRKLDPEITLTATRTLSPKGRGNHSGMSVGTPASTYVIIGAAIMGGIMIVMLASRGGTL